MDVTEHMYASEEMIPFALEKGGDYDMNMIEGIGYFVPEIFDDRIQLFERTLTFQLLALSTCHKIGGRCTTPSVPEISEYDIDDDRFVLKNGDVCSFDHSEWSFDAQDFDLPAFREWEGWDDASWENNEFKYYYHLSFTYLHRVTFAVYKY